MLKKYFILWYIIILYILHRPLLFVIVVSVARIPQLLISGLFVACDSQGRRDEQDNVANDGDTHRYVKVICSCHSV